MAKAENYPDLKANEEFTKLQSELSDVENKIAAARRFFNNAIAEYNTYRLQFPAIIIANSLGLKEEAFFDVPDNKDGNLNDGVAIKF